MQDGLLIYIIPFHRLTADICRVLCDNFDDLSMWRFMPDEFKRFKQVAVMGIRRKRQDGSALVADLMALALEPNNLRELSELPENRYPLPATAKKVDLFKGAEFNVVELAEQLKRSTSFSRLFEKNKLDSEIKRPLLPLNIGQIGLIGGSGLINGLVECDTPHIIKGRIVKENRSNTEENHNSRGDLMSTTLTETRSNKMIFNLLTPQGFISLTDYATGSTDTEPDEDDNDSNGGAYAPGAVAIKDRRLPLGRTVITSAAREVLSDNDINAAMHRHESGDWGDVTDSDRRSNDAAVKHDERILSSYQSIDGVKFWIITEWDRSATTVLLPEDY